jgi:hypothetical protein
VEPPKAENFPDCALMRIVIQGFHRDSAQLIDSKPQTSGDSPVEIAMTAPAKEASAILSSDGTENGLLPMATKVIVLSLSAPGSAAGRIRPAANPVSAI